MGTFIQDYSISTLAFLMAQTSRSGQFSNEIGTGRDFDTTLPNSEPKIMHRSDQNLQDEKNGQSPEYQSD
jgi:hypothetical protein